MFRAILLTLALATPATPMVAQSASRDIQPGSYELQLTYGGGLLDATLEIAYRGDTLTATLRLGAHDSPVKAGKRTGTHLVLEPTSPAMDVRYELDFKGDAVTGKFVFQGEAGTLNGKRKRAER